MVLLLCLLSTPQDQPVSEDDITILDGIMAMNGQRGRLHYYQGNIFKPFSIHSLHQSLVARAVRGFLRENFERVKADRSHPDYKTPMQLFDDQMAKVDLQRA